MSCSVRFFGESSFNFFLTFFFPSRYLGTENRRQSLNIFLEYAPGGSLRQLLQEVGSLEESIAATFTFQVKMSTFSLVEMCAYIYIVSI
jgi:serine/threonine protein kinase